VNKLGGCEHCIIPDRIEAGTFLIAGAITKGDILVEGITSGFLEAVLNKLIEAGIEIRKDINRIRVICKKIPTSVDMVTAPYPGFPTDMQPAFVSLMTKARGTSVVMETIYDSRFKYVDELRRMGANIRLVDNTAIIKGVKKLSAAPVEATDLRAGAALVIAALASEGETEISNIEHIQRGYENLEEKLRSLGGIIKKVE
jgi:UDP-N-acetylglucosamine 1-carboxyvinyltransferase